MDGGLLPNFADHPGAFGRESLEHEPRIRVREYAIAGLPQLVPEEPTSGPVTYVAVLVALLQSDLVTRLVGIRLRELPTAPWGTLPTVGNVNPRIGRTAAAGGRLGSRYSRSP